MELEVTPYLQNRKGSPVSMLHGWAHNDSHQHLSGHQL